MTKNNFYRRIVISFLLLTFSTLTIKANSLSELKFRRIDTRNGLSNSQANCVLKDSRGYVWIGTQYGLNRFDGFRVRSFYSKTSANKSLRFDFYDDLYEALDGKIWIKHWLLFSPPLDWFEEVEFPG